MAGTATALGSLLLLADFEAAGLSRDWEMARGGRAARVEEAGGAVLHVVPAPGSLLWTRRVPGDWSGVGAVRFRARAAAATSVEVRVLSGPTGASTWRKVDLAPGAWREVEVALPWMRRGEGPAPDLGRVRGLGLLFRDATEVWVDDVALVPGSPWLQPEELARVLGGTVTRGQRVAVVSQAPALDAPALVAHLDLVAARLDQALPWLADAPAPATLVVFPDEATHRRGVGDLGRAFAAQARAPDNDGYTLEGVATSSWSATRGTLRPVYVHETVHALLSARAGLPNEGEWLQEGLATWFQLQAHPQANLDEVLAQRRAAALPLAELCDGDRIPTAAYADAWSVVGTLLEDPAWQGTLARVLTRAAEEGTTDLAALGVDLAALEAARQAWLVRGWRE